MSLTPDHPGIADEYLCEIGRIIVSWNELESLVMSTMILTLLDGFSSDMRAQAAFAHMAFNQKMHALISMLRIADPDLANVYNSQVRKHLEDAQENRNKVVHHQWFTLDDGVKRFNMSARGTFKATMTPVSIEDLKAMFYLSCFAHSQLLLLITLPLATKTNPHLGQ